MTSFRVHSDRLSLPTSLDCSGERDDSNLEGVVATVKLLMKLIQDHKSACDNQQNDSRRMLRVAGMMTILDNVKARIQKCQAFGNNRKEAEPRLCETELHSSSHYPRDKRPTEPIDEKQKLRRELTVSLTARKSLEAMCSSLGKEKEIMSGELARKVHELSEMEELVNDLKTQNKTLSAKVKEFALGNKERKQNGVETTHGNMVLQERNRALSEQLLRSLDGYKSMKRKLKEAHEENRAIRAMMEEIKVEVGTSLERIQSFKQRVAIGNEPMVEIEEEIAELEHMFECFQIKVSKHGQDKGECLKPKGEISADNLSVLA